MALKSTKSTDKTPQVLVLQGGGALGSYQAGVYETMHGAELEPNWVAGISIGAINAALIAGNLPEDRVSRLREFWDLVSSELTAIAPADDGFARRWFNEISAAAVAAMGAPGFFRPRNPFSMNPDALTGDVSLYDTSPLRQTLCDLIDFDLLNSSPMRVSLGAVNVVSGNFCWFDNRTQEIQPEHVMASGALPPGFPPVVIDGEAYWDGGLVSNTPLQHVLDVAERTDLTIYQVDLFQARGNMPTDMVEVLRREKDIRYSSRTRFNTDAVQQLEELRLAAARLCEKLPPELHDDPDVKKLTRIEAPGAVCIMHLINRREMHESSSMDYEFSRASVNEHWKTGRSDLAISLAHPMWSERDTSHRGIVTHDLTNPAGARMRHAEDVRLFHESKGASTIPDS